MEINLVSRYYKNLDENNIVHHTLRKRLQFMQLTLFLNNLYLLV